MGKVKAMELEKSCGSNGLRNDCSSRLNQKNLIIHGHPENSRKDGANRPQHSKRLKGRKDRISSYHKKKKKKKIIKYNKSHPANKALRHITFLTSLTFHVMIIRINNYIDE